MSKRSKAGHTRVQKGKRVRILLQSGGCLIDKFVERKGNYVEFEENGKMPVSEIRTLVIYKPLPHELGA